MKRYSPTLLFNFFLAGCICDPPLKGKEIVIENQTENYIYVTDTLPLNERMIFFDTVYVNNNLYVSAKGNYIPKFSKWIYFLSDNEYKKKKERGIDSLLLYFVSTEHEGKKYQDIIKSKLYRVLNLNIDEIRKDEKNYIFYYSDSIRVAHEFDLKILH